MANRATLIADRATAGAAYAAAAQAYVDAFVELAAQDAAVCGNIVGGGTVTPFGGHASVLKHSEFLSRAATDAMISPNVLAPAIKARAEAIIASWSGS